MRGSSGAAVVARVLVLDDEAPDGQAMARVGAGLRGWRPPATGRRSRAGGSWRTRVSKAASSASEPSHSARYAVHCSGVACARALASARGMNSPLAAAPTTASVATRCRMARGVHEAEEAAPADPQDVDAPEAQRLPHALDVGDELILGALLDRRPTRSGRDRDGRRGSAAGPARRPAAPGYGAARRNRCPVRRADRGKAGRRRRSRRRAWCR